MIKPFTEFIDVNKHSKIFEILLLKIHDRYDIRNMIVCNLDISIEIICVFTI